MAQNCRSPVRLRQSIDSRMIASMNPDDVAELYRTLDQTGIVIGIDGGWAVDAVVGRQTRSHDDLDFAVEAKALDALRPFLAERGLRDGSTSRTRGRGATQGFAGHRVLVA